MKCEHKKLRVIESGTVDSLTFRYYIDHHLVCVYCNEKLKTIKLNEL